MSAFEAVDGRGYADVTRYDGLGAEIVVEAQIVAQLSVKCDSAGGRCSNRRRGRASEIGDSAGHGSGDSPKYSSVRDAEESA